MPARAPTRLIVTHPKSPHTVPHSSCTDGSDYRLRRLKSAFRCQMTIEPYRSRVVIVEWIGSNRRMEWQEIRNKDTSGPAQFDERA